jgi:hypothetical protein
MRHHRLKLGALLVAGLATAAVAATALASPAPPVASIADRTIHGGITFAVGTGAIVHVVPAGGGHEGSNCTRDEVGVNPAKTTTEDRERFVVHFVAKSGGSCGVGESWSNFHLSVRHGSFYGEGTFFMGQKAIAGGYQMACDMRSGNSYRFRWHNLQCHKNPQVSHFELEITKAP